jgi:MSHA biogenesis protein MshN
MSLINQMLQDLDSRGTESVGTGAMYAQIRSVPQAHKRPSALWRWLPVLCVPVAAVSAWQWMRHPDKVMVPAKPVVQMPAPVAAQLDGLKLSSDLSIAQLQTLPPAEQAKTDISEPAIATGTSADKSPDERQHAAEKPEPRPVLKASSNASMPVASTAPNTSPAAATQAQPNPVAEKTGDAVSVTLNKQVSELTVQQRAENEYRKALVLAQQGKQQDAIAGLEHALQLDRQNASARQTLAGLLIEAKRTDEAAQKLQEGLALDPTQAGLAMILARVQVDKGDVTHAIETLQRTLPYASTRADYQALLAALLQRGGRHKEAVEHYVAALEQNPQNGVWWMGLGISLQAESRVPEAQEAYGRAKASNTLSPALLAYVDQKLNQLKH